jgi:KDO2-lipid IV(A) lauroyltransferase
MDRKAWLIWWSLTLLGRLPLGWLQYLGRALAGLWWWTRPRARRVTLRNLALAYPELDAASRERLARAVALETGAGVLELAALWTEPVARTRARVVAVEGWDAVQAARRAGRPTILVTPHLGQFELLNPFFATELPGLWVLYRSPRQAWLEPLLLRARQRGGARLLRAEPRMVRALLQHLEDGGALGILPDQQPKAGEGEFAPFFGVPALTMTLLPKLARRTGAQVWFTWAERLPAGRGFRVHVEAADPPLDDAVSLNQNVERLVRRCPEQYQWSYKRYSIRPPGEPPLY